MKIKPRSYRIIVLLVLIASLVGGCSSNKVGTLVGAKISMGLSDAVSGEIDEVDFGGIVIIELDDGTKVNAIWDKSLGDQMIGGMKLEIAPTDDPDLWKVVKIVEIP